MDFAWSDDEENNDVLMEISTQLEENEVNTTQDECLEQNFYASHFVCPGEDASGSFHNNSFMQNNELALIMSPKYNNPDRLSIFNQKMCCEIFLEKNFLLAMFMRAKSVMFELKFGKKFPRAIVESNYEKRMHITKLLHHVRNSLDDIDRDHLYSCLSILENTTEADDSVPNATVLETIHKSPSSTTHHFFHGWLEWRWLHLTIIYRDYQHSDFESDFKKLQCWEKLLDTLNLYIFDLLKISLIIFNNSKIHEIYSVNPFACLCIKESWYLIICLLETLQEKITFWEIFSNTITCLVSSKGSEKIRNVRLTPDKCENSQIFTMWLLLNMVKFQDITPKKISKETLENIDLLDSSLKIFFEEDPSEQETRAAIRIVSSLILDYWPLAIDVIIPFWEYFHKKINTNFYSVHDGTNSLLVSNDSAMSYIKTARHQLDSSMKTSLRTQTSYSTFCQVIGHFLQKFRNSDYMKNFQRITGRIFIKFTSKKWQAMNETGIHNLIILLVIMATVGDEKITERVETICLLIPLTELSASRQLAASKGLIALLIFAFRKSRASQYAGKLMSKFNLNDLEGSTQCAVLKVFAHGICDIFTESERFSEDEHILIGSWLREYLKSCTENDREFMLNQLNRNVIRIQGIVARGDDSGNLQELLKALFTHILPYIREELEGSDKIMWLPELAGNLCLVASGQNDLPNIEELFNGFMEMNCRNPNYLFSLFSLVVTSEKVTTLNSSALIHHWFRCMIFSSGASAEDLRMVTEAIATLPELQEVCAITREEFLSSKDPFYVFLFGIGQKYEQLESARDRMVLSNKFQNYVKSFEKWALQGILHTQEGASNIYRTIAVIVLHCAHIIYVPMKSNSFLKILVSEFILPSSLLVGKTQSVHVIKAMLKIFPVFLEGIGKLNFKADTYLLKLISDMIMHWTPHFRSATNASMAAKPFVKIFSSKNSQLAVTVMEKYCECCFPQIQRKSSVSHTPLAVNILREIFQQTLNSSEVFENLLDITCLPLMDHVLMTNDSDSSRKLVLELLEYVFGSSTYKSQSKFRHIVVKGLKNITSTKLSFQTSAFFLFMLKIGKINPLAVQDLLPFLQEQIVEVEYRRGSGRDARLRQQFNSLEQMIISSKKTS
ncbi:hypothetical protein DMENIID0001_050810 [Sergentomyia squamirostris]